MEDLAGKRFGKLTVLSFVKRNNNYVQIWKCLCDCGNEVNVIRTSLIRGNTRSCGCLNNETRVKKRPKLNNHICPNCGIECYIKPSRLKKSSLIFCCMDCRTRYYQTHKELMPKFKVRTKEQKFFDEKFTRWKMSARKRKISFDETLTSADLMELWEKQRHKCYYTGVDMTFDKEDELHLVSIDRIDSSIGYTKNNIVLCTYAFNSFKFNYNIETVRKFIKEIKENSYEAQ